ncbi:MAG: FAD-linked oxidase C-terminal domain-containing protein [Anaerolineae bacterium]
MTAAYVKGLTAVLADGDVVRLGGRALDPPGPDAIGLLVGSEGTLAIVTELVLRLVPRPPAAGTLLAAFDDAVAAGAAVAAIVARGLVPAAIELMDRSMLAIIDADRVAARAADRAADRLVGRDEDGGAHARGSVGPEPAAVAVDGASAGAVLIVEVDGHPSSIGPQLAAVAAAVESAGAAAASRRTMPSGRPCGPAAAGRGWPSSDPRAPTTPPTPPSRPRGCRR